MSGVMTIVLAAGGTGGHMFPADALAAELIERGHTPILITDNRGARYGEVLPTLKKFVISAGGLAGRGPLGRVKGAVNLGIGVLQARAHLKALRPSCVVGFGGYAAAPTMTAAVHLKMKTVIHEQNAYLGRANRMLAGQVNTLCLSFDQTQGLPAETHTTVTGMPVRAAVRSIAGTGYARPGVDDKFRILVMGGSQGATVFSTVVPDAIKHLPQALKSRLVIHQQCRPADLDDARKAYDAEPVEADLQPFFENVPELLKAAHLVITRSGSSTCAELTAAGRPALLVPYPHAADDHQSLNARALDKAGAAWVMPQPSFTAGALAERLDAFLTNTAPLAKAAACALAIGRPDAAQDLTDAVLATAGANGHSNARGAA